jgi:hypothetical protein
MLQSGAKTARRGVPASPAIRLQENACVLQGGREVGKSLSMQGKSFRT